MQVFKIAWIPIDIPPVEVGSYLVTTCKGKIRLDRYDGDQWGLCKPRAEVTQMDKGRYRPHKAWAMMPDAFEPERKE